MRLVATRAQFGASSVIVTSIAAAIALGCGSSKVGGDGGAGNAGAGGGGATSGAGGTGGTAGGSGGASGGSRGSDGAAGTGGQTGADASAGATLSCGGQSCQRGVQVCCRERASNGNACVAENACPAAAGRAVLLCDGGVKTPTGIVACCFNTLAGDTVRAGLADACGATSVTPPINVRLCSPANNECGSRTCQPTDLGGWLPPGYHACL